jgi:hypothetical protein
VRAPGAAATRVVCCVMISLPSCSNLYTTIFGSTG